MPDATSKGGEYTDIVVMMDNLNTQDDSKVKPVIASRITPTVICDAKNVPPQPKAARIGNLNI